MTHQWRISAVLILLIARAAAAAPTPLPQLPSLDWEPRSDWRSVKATGAVGDGKVDDTSAIQATLDLIANGVTVYFPPGDYRVTGTLFIRSPNEKALRGIALIGHGRDTRIRWDGPEGGTLVQAEGMCYSRWVGFDFDGAGKAALGHYHRSLYTFETVHRKVHVAFRNFTKAGVYAEPTDDKFAIAETSLENCLFENCGIGMSFTQFNDYNITFDGCEFRRCGTGIECIHGNFYARNCHFEQSRVVDIRSASEHGSSIRRCTSLNSRLFVTHANPVATLAIEGCTVAAWQDPSGAVSVTGAPVMVFDCTFTDPPADATCAINVRSHHQRLIWSQIMVPDGLPRFNHEAKERANVHLYEIPAGKTAGVLLSPRQQFLKSSARVAGKVFDAKRDFGAVGDARTDDTAAIQRTIDAARRHGHDAIAYVPAGRYAVKQTLCVSGKDYRLGGAGPLATYLQWQGEPEGVTIAVQQPQDVTIEHLNLEKRTGTSVMVTDGGRPATLTCDGLFVIKRLKHAQPPFPPGILCRDLGPDTTVIINGNVGGMHFDNSARATVLVPLSYYGTFVVEGEAKKRDGLLGVLSRFSGGDYNVIVKDNHSVVMSDYYSENSGNIFLLQGAAGDPPGRVVVQGAKLHLNEKRAKP
ncbi:MAG: hypothetical protein ISR77_16710 [Pirellulaceae bacterium]|nr:hypothetical protein [Pirellulaceae bacterium]